MMIKYLAKRETVLIIEDDMNAAHAIVTLCFELGIEPLLARDGFTGMLLARRIKPRLILADLSTPGLDGFEIVRRIRNHQELAGTAIVAITSSAPRPPSANQHSFDDFLLKPINAAQLERIVKCCSAQAGVEVHA